MGYTPVVLPTNTNIDRSESEAPPTTPRLLGLATEFVEGMQQAPLADLTSHLAKLYDEKYNPGRFMNQNEIKQTYPDVFDQFKQGGYENVIKDINDKKQKEIYNQELINNMPGGFLSGVSKVTGFLTANALDPINFMAGFGVEATVGKWGAQLLPRIPEEYQKARMAARTLFGVTEGGLVTTPMALSARDYYNQLNMHMSAWDTAKMIGFGGGLGGILRTAIGYRSPITADAHENALAVAQDQMAEGKKVNVEPIVKQGSFDARQVEGEDNLESLQASRELLNDQIERATNERESLQSRYDELTKDKPESFDRNATIRGTDIIDRSERLSKIAPHDLTADDEEFLNALPDTDEIKAAMTYKKMEPGELTPQEQKFLDRFNRGEEKDMLKENLEKRDKELNKLKKDLKKVREREPENEEKINNLKEQLEEVQRKMKGGKDRLKVLNQSEREPKRITETRAKWQEADARLRNLMDVAKDTEAHIELLSKENKPVAQEELRAAANNVNSYKGNETTNLSEESQFEQEVKTPQVGDDKVLNDLNQTIDAMKDAGALDKESETALSELETQEAREGKINDQLRQAIVCLIEAEE